MFGLAGGTHLQTGSIVEAFEGVIDVAVGLYELWLGPYRYDDQSPVLAFAGGTVAKETSEAEIVSRMTDRASQVRVVDVPSSGVGAGVHRCVVAAG